MTGTATTTATLHDPQPAPDPFTWALATDRASLTLVLLASTAVRMLLRLAGAGDFLSSFAPLHTPTSSWKRFSEGLFLYQRGMNLYDNNIFHQAHFLVFVGLDVIAAICLYLIAHRQRILEPLAHLPASNDDHSSTDWWPPVWVAGCFLLNPFSIISCLVMDVGVIERTLMLFAAAAACQGDSVWSSMALSISFQHGFYALALIPIVALIQRRANHLSSMALIPAMFMSVGAWLGVSTMFMHHVLGLNPSNVFSSTIGFILNVSDMAPNIGSWWYFLQEVFDHFRDLFVFVFHAHVFIYLVPMLIRYGKDLPIFCFGVYLGVIAILRSYPTVGDYAAWFAFMPMYANSWKYHRYSFLSMTLFLFTSMLFPAMYLLYARFHSGNANFPYALTLLACSAATMMQSDFLYGVLLRVHHVVTRAEVSNLVLKKHEDPICEDESGVSTTLQRHVKSRKSGPGGQEPSHSLDGPVLGAFNEYPSVLMYTTQ